MKLSGLVLIIIGACLIQVSAQEVSRNNKAVAVKTVSPISIDGNLAEWDKSYPLTFTGEEQVNSMGLWSDLEDFSVIAYIMWDDENLYIGAEVTDDLPFRILETPQIDGVDALSLYLNTDTSVNPDRTIYASTDFRVLFAIDNKLFPTAVDRDPVLIKKGFQTMGMNSDKNVLPGYKVIAKTTARGYIFELKLPFKALSNDRLPVLKPSVGALISFNLQFMDLDEATEDEVDSIGDRVSYITLFPGNPATNPGDWGFLEFK